MHKFEGTVCPDTLFLQGYKNLFGGGGEGDLQFLCMSFHFNQQKVSSPCSVSPNQGASSTKHCGFMQISDILVFKWNYGL